MGLGGASPGRCCALIHIPCVCHPHPGAARLPAKAKRTYLYLHSERQYSDLTLFGAMLAVPVVVGLSLICFLDAYYSRRPAHLPPLHVHHQHFD